jgi:hypothetical protein
MITEAKYPKMEKGVQIKDVPGYEGWYAVTDDGRVWSMPREVFSSTGVKRNLKGRWLRPVTRKVTGYKAVVLCADCDRKTTTVYALVAAAFLGPRPEGSDTDHMDRNPGNDRASNLRYVTRSVNMSNNSTRGYSLTPSGRWQAYIRVKRQLHYLGLHDTPEAAREAHVAAKKLHGVFTP